MAEFILEGIALSKTYRAGPRRRHQNAEDAPRPALANVSIAVRAGETVGVVGESGSGKTTLARCLALLIRPDQGQVILGGESLTELSSRQFRARRRRIQTIFQDPFSSLNPRMTAGSTLAEVLRVHRLVPRGRVQDRVAELLSLVGLSASAAAKYPSEFSGGQRQRVSIARALAAEPDVLIADEPVSALDVSIQAQILNLLVDLREELGLAMIFIGHDLPVVTHVAPRLAVMFSGQIVELLPSGVLLSDARHPYTLQLLAAAPSLSADPLPEFNLGAMESSAPYSADRCVFWDRCEYRTDPRCETENPPFRELAPGHFVASFCDTEGPDATMRSSRE